MSQALHGLKVRMAVTWVMDSGLDDVAVWRTIGEQQEHLVCRLSHTERLVEYQDDLGQWVAGDIQSAQRRVRLLGTAQTEMVVCRGRQRKAKRQPVTAEIRACPIRLTYPSNVRREGPGETVQKEVWLVQVRLPDVHLKPWLLLTDGPVTNAESAVRIFRLYRQPWGVEDSLSSSKTRWGGRKCSCWTCMGFALSWRWDGSLPVSCTSWG